MVDVSGRATDSGEHFAANLSHKFSISLMHSGSAGFGPMLQKPVTQLSSLFLSVSTLQASCFKMPEGSGSERMVDVSGRATDSGEHFAANLSHKFSISLM